MCREREEEEEYVRGCVYPGNEGSSERVRKKYKLQANDGGLGELCLNVCVCVCGFVYTLFLCILYFLRSIGDDVVVNVGRLCHGSLSVYVCVCVEAASWIRANHIEIGIDDVDIW